jgi:formylglycine-generating enzyme required for sulfatase activity
MSAGIIGNGTFTDASSGLMWQKDDDGETRTKEEAVAYCRGLKLAGFADWRLPTLQEFQALARAASGNELGVVAHFSLSASDVYWTATPGPQSNVSHVADGTTMFNTNKYPVRAVRRA